MNQSSRAPDHGTTPSCELHGAHDGQGCPKCAATEHIRVDCPTCHGMGQVEGERAEWVRTGEEMRADREARGVSLQSEASHREMPLFLLVQMEQGLVRPVPSERLLL